MRVGAHALEGFDIRGVRFDLREAREKRRHAVAELLKQMVARFAAAEPLSGGSSAGDDQLVAKICLPCRGQRLVASCLVLDLDNIAAGHDVRPLRLKRKAQNVKNAGGLVGKRIDLARVLGHGQKAEPLKKRKRPSHIEALQRETRKLGLLAVVVRQTDVAVREIAAAVSGREQLFAHAALPL